MAYVYILQDTTSGRYYTGSCFELSTRIARHKRHTGGKTTKRGNWVLVCYTVCKDIAEARDIEKKVKSYKGGNVFKEIISGKNKEWRGG